MPEQDSSHAPAEPGSRSAPASAEATRDNATPDPVLVFAHELGRLLGKHFAEAARGRASSAQTTPPSDVG
jgi:hypothetical protein